MSFLSTTANVLASHLIGPAYSYGKPLTMGAVQGNLLEASKNLAYSTLVVPLVGAALFSIPPIQKAVHVAGECIAAGPGKVAEWWVSKSVKNTTANELTLNLASVPKSLIEKIKNSPKAPQSEQDKTAYAFSQIEAHLQRAVIAALQPIIATNNVQTVKDIISAIAINTIAECAQSQAAALTVGRFFNMPAPSLATTAYCSLLSNGISAALLLDRGDFSESAKQELKNQLASHLLKSIQEQEAISSKLETCLQQIIGKIAETVIEDSTTDLAALKSLLTSDDTQGIFAKISNFFHMIIRYIKDLGLADSVVSPKNNPLID